MDAGVAMNEGWVCGECTAADEADAAGEEDEHDAPRRDGAGEPEGGSSPPCEQPRVGQGAIQPNGTGMCLRRKMWDKEWVAPRHASRAAECGELPPSVRPTRRYPEHRREVAIKTFVPPPGRRTRRSSVERPEGLSYIEDSYGGYSRVVRIILLLLMGWRGWRQGVGRTNESLSEAGPDAPRRDGHIAHESGHSGACGKGCVRMRAICQFSTWANSQANSGGGVL
jgi:hypothetical protein